MVAQSIIRAEKDANTPVAVLECTNEHGRELEVDNGRGRDTTWLHSACNSEEGHDHDSRQRIIIKVPDHVNKCNRTANFGYELSQTNSPNNIKTPTKCMLLLTFSWMFLAVKIMSTVPLSRSRTGSLITGLGQYGQCETVVQGLCQRWIAKTIAASDQRLATVSPKLPNARDRGFGSHLFPHLSRRRCPVAVGLYSKRNESERNMASWLARERGFCCGLAF